MAKESDFQGKLIEEIKEEFKGCVVLKNDPNYIQGFPDLTILYGNRWATLECKRSRNAKHQRNQDYYVELCNSMSYSSFIFPENKEVILDELRRTFRS